MAERIIDCQNKGNQACNGCEVTVEVARNVMSRMKAPVVESILQVTTKRCPTGTKFQFNGDLGSLVDNDDKIIQLRPINGELITNTEISGSAAAGL